MKITKILNRKALLPFTLAVLLCSTPSVLAGQSVVSQSNEPMVIAEKFTFQSTILNEVRTFYVHLPNGYSAKNNKYPVLYIPDGKRKMQKTVAITDDLAGFSQRIPKMIVVGIETNKNRTADLSTLASSKAFLNFITTELKPYIENTYATNGENLLMGSSMGGEFVVRALFEQPKEFDGYFSISPSIYYSDFQLVEKANELSKSKKAINKKLYLSVANEGWNQGVEELVYHLKKQPIQGLTWQFSKHEEESHGSISMGQAYNNLQQYYVSWATPHFKNTLDFERKGGVEGLKTHYAQRTPSIIPIGVLDHMSLLYVDQQQSKEAIELSLLSVKEHPTSGRALRNLAHVYEKLAMPKQALSAYEQALATAIKNNHKASSIASHQKALANFKTKLNK
jgi:predicted alpha/beta superfamily hydrolase